MIRTLLGSCYCRCMRVGQAFSVDFVSLSFVIGFWTEWELVGVVLFKNC